MMRLCPPEIQTQTTYLIQPDDEKKPNNQLKDPASNFCYQNFKSKRWWRGKSADQKLPVEIGNKLQIINQIRGEKKSVCLQIIHKWKKFITNDLPCCKFLVAHVYSTS